MGALKLVRLLREEDEGPVAEGTEGVNDDLEAHQEAAAGIAIVTQA